MTAAAQDVRTQRPTGDEYAPYFDRYIAKVNPGDVVRQLEAQSSATIELLRSIPEERGGHRYADGKWSIREVVGHICDSERVFVYRAMRFARGDDTPLAGFDENAFVANSRLDTRTLASLIAEFDAVRMASVAFFDSLDAGEWMRRGLANDREMSVRALAWTTAGHELHHREILRTRYL